MARAPDDHWIVIAVALGCVVVAALAVFVWVYVLGMPGPYRLACTLAYGHPRVWRLMRCP